MTREQQIQQVAQDAHVSRKTAEGLLVYFDKHPEHPLMEALRRYQQKLLEK